MDVVRADVEGGTAVTEPETLASALVVWGGADVVVLAFATDGDDAGDAPAFAVAVEERETVTLARGKRPAMNVSTLEGKGELAA